VSLSRLTPADRPLARTCESVSLLGQPLAQAEDRIQFEPAVWLVCLDPAGSVSSLPKPYVQSSLRPMNRRSQAVRPRSVSPEHLKDQKPWPANSLTIGPSSVDLTSCSWSLPLFMCLSIHLG
jgi:hypothetical protein